MQSGKWYIAGEHGPEAIWGGGGAYAMGYGGGGNGGGGVSISTHIDARGASVELISRLPAVLKANNEQLEAKIASRMRRGYYGNAR
jgi:NAD(P)H-hydrate repair Nnr-like enzyme with NAD(P)H-hydrate epimerase domain